MLLLSEAKFPQILITPLFNEEEMVRTFQFYFKVKR